MYVYTSSFYLCHRKDLEMHLSSSQFFPFDINERIETKNGKMFNVSHIQQQHVDEIFTFFIVTELQNTQDTFYALITSKRK